MSRPGRHPIWPQGSRRPRMSLKAARLVVPLIAFAISGTSCTASAVHRSTPSAPTSATSAETAAFPPYPDRAPPPAEAARLQQALHAAVAGHIATGATAALISPSWIWAGADGVAGNGSRLVPREAMAIGSITKTFTAAEVMRLTEQGKINLDARLSSYIKLPVPDNGATVRDALDMQSGIPDLWDNPAFPRWLDAVPPDTPVTPDDLLTYVNKQISAPNRLWEYSNTNYILLGKIIAKVTGRSFARAIREDLILPAGLDRVFVQADERPSAPLALPAKNLAGAGKYLPNRKLAGSAAAAGSIAADAASLARWGYELFGGHVLAPTSLSAMVHDNGAGYGFGCYPSHLLSSDAHVIGHSGYIDGFRSQLWVDRQHQMAVVVLLATNRQDPAADPSSVADDLLAIALNR